MGVRIKRWNFKMLGKLEPFNFLFCKKKPTKKPKNQTNQKKNNPKTKLRPIAGFWDLWFLLDCHIITVLWEEASLQKNKYAVSDPQTSAAIVLTLGFFSVCFCSFLLKCNMYRFCSSLLYVYLCGTAAMSHDLHWTRKERPAPPPPLTRESAADTHGHACAYWTASCPSTPWAAVFM